MRKMDALRVLRSLVHFAWMIFMALTKLSIKRIFFLGVCVDCPELTKLYSGMHLYYYIRVVLQPSQIRFSCLPMSRVECMLKLPSLDLVFSSNRGELEVPAVATHPSDGQHIPPCTPPGQQIPKSPPNKGLKSITNIVVLFYLSIMHEENVCRKCLTCQLHCVTGSLGTMTLLRQGAAIWSQ